MQDNNLTEFQMRSGSCMRVKCNKLIKETTNELTEDNPLKSAIHSFIEWYQHQLSSFENTLNIFNYTEMCSECFEEIDMNTQMCPQWHKVQRCAISYTQVHTIYMPKNCFVICICYFFS